MHNSFIVTLKAMKEIKRGINSDLSLWLFVEGENTGLIVSFPQTNGVNEIQDVAIDLNDCDSEVRQHKLIEAIVNDCNSYIKDNQLGRS